MTNKDLEIFFNSIQKPNNPNENLRKAAEIYKQNFGRGEMQAPECLHERCPECHGTGRKKNGMPCIHMISCPCPKCNPSYLI